MSLIRLAAACILSSAFLWGAQATAAPVKKPAKSQFYAFGEDLIEGGTRGPSVEMFKGREDVKFGRMLRLKKDLLPRIYTSRNARTFK